MGVGPASGGLGRPAQAREGGTRPNLVRHALTEKAEQFPQAQGDVLHVLADCERGVGEAGTLRVQGRVVGKADPFLGDAQQVLMDDALVCFVMKSLDGVFARGHLIDLYDRSADCGRGDALIRA